MASVLLPQNIQEQLTQTQFNLWMKFETIQSDFHQQLSIARKYSSDLERQLEENLKNILIEGLSTSSREASSAIHTVEKLSNFLGEGLSHLTTAADLIGKSSIHLAASSQTETIAISDYLFQKIDPSLQKAGDSLIALASHIEQFSEDSLKEYPLLKLNAKLFAGTFKSIGHSAKGLSGIINQIKTLDALLRIPALQQFTNGIHRMLGVVHSAAESIREFCLGAHVRCANIAQSINIKSDAAANQKLEALVVRTAEKAKHFLWTCLPSFESIREAPTPKTPKLPISKRDKPARSTKTLRTPAKKALSEKTTKLKTKRAIKR